jgi:hypothetical protein
MVSKKNNTPKKKNPYFGNYDLYSDANPNDTIRIKYDTVENTKKTIKKLERLRKSSKYTHARIVQVANVMTQRLRVIYNNTGKGKTRYNLSKSYFEKLKKETKKKNSSRRKNKTRRKSPKRKSKSRKVKTTKYRKKSAVWSRKYKDSIDCKHPKGFSQRAHCASKKKHSKFTTKSRRRKSPKRKSKSRRINSGLGRWFAEEWIDVCKLPKIVKCGRSKAQWKNYPYCRPRKRISKSTPKTAGELTKAEIKQRCAKKKRNPTKRILPKRKSKSVRRKS